MLDKLVKIPHSDLSKLRDLFKKDWPKHCLGYYTVDNYYQWFNRYSNIADIHVYSLNGDWSDGSYLILDFNHLQIGTCSDDHSKIIKLLSLVDWSKSWDIFGYSENIKNEVKEFFQLYNIKVNNEIKSFLHYMPREEALKFNFRIPEGYLLKELTEKNTEVIHSVWPHRKQGTFDYLNRLIKHNPSIGVFTENDELIAWIMRSQIGTLGVLQVQEEYKYRGFGSLVVQAFGKFIAEMGDDIIATVMINNTPSLNMFKKLGFKIIDNIYWVEIL